MKRHRRLLAVLFLIALPVIFFATCIQRNKDTAVDIRGEAYAGAAACITCHKNISSDFQHSAHGLSSRPANIKTVAGSFTAPNNEFVYGPEAKVVLEKRDSGLFQVAVTKIHGPDGITTREVARRFDIAMGSGRKAQTFLYWDGDTAFQLPVSYFVTEHAWANSPNFPRDHARFDRAINKDCFDCHSSYIKEKDPVRKEAFHQTDQFDRSQVVYGIDCERCHGPGARHADWQSQHPEDKLARYIARYGTLGRQQRLDMCAICHSGLHSLQRSAFTFQPGDTLSHFFSPEFRIAGAASAMDVHGNQYQLLIASQCFLKSKTLDCSSCHDPHVKERDNLALLSQRCINCHNQPDKHPAIPQSAGQPAMIADAKILRSNCIDCHMPGRASRAITLLTQADKDPVADLVRTHLITIYPEATNKYLTLHPEIAAGRAKSRPGN